MSSLGTLVFLYANYESCGKEIYPILCNKTNSMTFETYKKKLWAVVCALNCGCLCSGDSLVSLFIYLFIYFIEEINYFTKFYCFCQALNSQSAIDAHMSPQFWTSLPITSITSFWLITEPCLSFTGDLHQILTGLCLHCIALGFHADLFLHPSPPLYPMSISGFIVF